MIGGEGLFGVVLEYSGFGDHRSGTGVDGATADWFGGLLGDLGLTVESQDVGFERYDARSELLASGEAVEHLPLFYEFTGEVDTDDVAVRLLDPLMGGFPRVADQVIADTKAEGREALVVVTDHPDGELVAVNRDLDAPRSGLPTVLVGSRHYETLRDRPLRLRLEATTEPATTPNLHAFNDLSGPRLLITTPLNGWFRCAGERGTGIAVLCELVRRFADLPLLVVATGGHELGFLGAEHWVRTQPYSGQVACVAHIGSSVAMEDTLSNGLRQLTRSRMAMTNVASGEPPDSDAEAPSESPTSEPVTEPLARAGFVLRPGLGTWTGEGDVWRRLGTPVMSVMGGGTYFHTPADVPHKVTSPESLATVAQHIGDAVAALYEISTAAPN